MTFKYLIPLLLSLPLMSCGGGGSDTSKEPSPTATPPVITLSVDSASIDESSTIVITHLAKDYQDTTITSELSCDIGTLDGNNYTAPSVATETTATCTATATDSGNRSTTETLTFTINAVTPVLALANGETSATTAKLTTIDVSFADISEGLIDATLNGEAIKLAITPDKQLVYFPPMGAIGLQTLELTIEGEVVTYEYQAQDSSSTFADANVYLNDFLVDMQTQIEEIIQAKSLNGAPTDEITQLQTLKEYYNPNNTTFTSMTVEEKEYLATFVFENLVFFEEQSNSLSKALGIKAYKQATLAECTDESINTLKYVVSTGIFIAAAGASLTTGPAALVLAPLALSGAIISAGRWERHWKETYSLCTEWANSKIFSDSSFSSPKNLKLSKPIISSKENTSTLSFFSNESSNFTAQNEYQYLDGSLSDLNKIVTAFNQLSNNINYLFDKLGRDNVPNYIENIFNEPLILNDLLFEDINPNNLSVSAITDAGVTGDITDINENNSFKMTFNIEDLNVPHIAFQFTITDSGHDTPLSTVIDAEVTLNPPIVYSETFAAVIGEDMTARLQADFETGFEIKTLPQKGMLDTSGAFSFPGGGLFTYTPDENITEDTSDSFTFIATNGSTINNGESNIATITIQLTAELDCSIYSPLVLGGWTVTTISDGEVSGEPYNLELYENGVGRYIIEGSNGANRDGIDENGNSYYTISWEIQKRNNMCYLSERGFYHYGFEQYRTYHSSLTDAHLEIPVSSFYTYTDFGDGFDRSRQYVKN